MTDDDLERLFGTLVAADEARRTSFSRSLPVGEHLNDRWQRARRLGFGDGASIYDSAIVFEPVSVGPRTWIGPWVILDGSGGGLTIGADCNVSAGVHIYTHDTVLRTLSGGAIDRAVAPVAVGDRSYIGPHAVIRAGVSIGDECVVGANSFVNANVPSRTVVAGSPARVVAKVEGTGVDVRIVPLD
jgi:serine acetyltransferase